MRFTLFCFALSNFLAIAFAHSMMTCAIKSADGTSCIGPIRDSANSISSAAYRFNQDPSGQICQPNARGVGNLAKYYPNGMGSLSAGSTFKVEWPARNHAVNNQNPRTVKVFMSPAIASGQTADFSSSVMMQNKICEGPFINCGKGAGVDTTGDNVPCTLSCTVPANTPGGTYTLWWQWDWTVNDGSIYATCADVTVSSNVVNPPAQVPNSPPATTAANSPVVATSAQSPPYNPPNSPPNSPVPNSPPNNPPNNSPQTSETSAVTNVANVNSCGDPSLCSSACGGAEYVLQCSCLNNQVTVHCSSGAWVTPAVFLFISLALSML